MSKIDIHTTTRGIITLDAVSVTVDGDFLRFCFEREETTTHALPRMFRGPEIVEVKGRKQYTLALIKSADVLCVLPAASGMEAPSGGETVQQGSTEGDSPTGEAGDAQQEAA